MKQFIAKFADRVDGILCGFDRLVMRGELRALYIANGGGIEQYLRSSQVMFKDFRRHVPEVSRRLKEASLAAAMELGRVVRYVPSAVASKEDIARQIAAEQKIQSGLVCVLSSVEPCMSFQAVPNRETQKLDFKLEPRKCLHLYHYLIHPVFGFMNARIQTWFPFRIQICLNGREWLARSMDAAGLPYVRQDNCFPWIEDFPAAQRLMEEQLSTNWPEELNRIAVMLNPIHEEIFRHFHVKYYWTTHQSEWAIDIRFPKQEELRRLYLALLGHAITTFGSPNVLRFLGKPTRLDGSVPRWYSGELFSDLKQRAEGMRIKHYIDGNSLKAYDKAYTPVGSILRLESTINEVAPFRSYRPKEGDPQGPQAWRPMRRGVADLHRRAEVSQKAAERYADGLASVDDTRRLEELTEKLERSTEWQGRAVRGLRVLGEDNRLLLSVSRGEFNLNGFRNRDLQRLLYHGQPADAVERKRRCGAVSRKLRMLRAHRLIKKVPHTHRYLLTDLGRVAIAAISAAQHATVAQLSKAA
jgi:DNA-binding HxlR family transcriptional regulator